MRVQKEIVLARELDHAAHHRQVRIRAEVEFADPRHICVFNLSSK